jgi:hypothetical protein
LRLVAGGWFVLREKYCWLVADKPSEQALDPWDLPACARTLSLELQQNNMHVQINGNGRLRQSILMFLD